MSTKKSLDAYRFVSQVAVVCTAIYLMVPLLFTVSLGQEAQKEKTLEVSTDDLVFLENEYSKFQKRGTELQNSFERIMKAYADSETQFKLIKNEELRQQREQANAEMQQMFLQMKQQSLQAAASPQLGSQPGTNRRADTLELRQQSNRVAVEQAQIGLESFARSQQMAQLSAAERLVFQKYQQAVGDYYKLSGDFQKWLSDSVAFLPRYWRFCDAEGSNSSKTNEEILQLLKQSEPSNPFSLLVRGLLAMRMDDAVIAEDCLSRVSKNGGAVAPIADAGLAVFYTNKKQKQKAEESLRRAKVGRTRFPVSNHYVGWLMAQECISKRMYSVAIKELDSLTDVKDFEYAARRQISLIKSLEGKTKHKPSERNLKGIRIVSDVVGSKDWYTELVYAMCLYANDSRQEAILRAEHATEIAPEDRREDCQRVLNQIVSEKDLSWAFWD